MKSQVTLLLICMLFSKVFSLNCMADNCDSGSGSCTQTNCDHCVTSTISATFNGQKQSEWIQKSCRTPQTMCESYSYKSGGENININVKCCSTDFCNRETLPAPLNQAPNGRMCYSWVPNTGTETVMCQGDQFYCFTATGIRGEVGKGCASKSYCKINTVGSDLSHMECCQGNLCNSAKIFTLSFILIIIPLLSFILSY